MGIYADKQRIVERKFIIQGRKGRNRKQLKSLQVIDNQQEEYQNILFENLINKGKTFNKVVFENCQFVNCEFYGTVFEHCSFSPCAFFSCKLIDVKFINCNFWRGFNRYGYGADPYKSGLININGMYDIDNLCYFDNSEIDFAQFDRCNLNYSYFQDVTFTEVVFNESNMEETLFQSCDFMKCKIESSSLLSSEFLEIQNFNIDFIKYNEFGFDRFTHFICSKSIRSRDVFIYDEDVDILKRYDLRSRTYFKLCEFFKKQGIKDLSGEYYYLAKQNERNSCKGLRWFSLTLVDALCGYKERPSHTFICIILNILLFGLFYLFAGVGIGDRIISLSEIEAAWPNIIEVFKLYCHSVFFSVTTFSTVGYGNYVPVGPFSSTLAAIQMLMGVSLTALWTGCVFRKISR